MAKEIKKGMYVVFMDENEPKEITDYDFHIVKNKTKTLCEDKHLPKIDKYYKNKPKAVNSVKVSPCECCEELQVPEKKTPAKKKK